MTIRVIRDARKRIYRLQERDDAISRALLGALLFAYRLLDSLVLKKASKADYGSEKYLMTGQKVLYVGVPKVATRSLLAAMDAATAESGQPGLFLETDVETVLRKYPDSSNYFTFTFVRNPWSRAASCYRDKIQNTDRIKSALHFNGRDGLEAGMSFEEFAEWLNTEAGSDDVADRHWMSQYRVLALDERELISYDFVGRLENLLGDYARLQELATVPLPPLSHRLKTQAPDEFKALYNERCVELIAKRYARDIELFAYSFDDSAAV